MGYFGNYLERLNIFARGSIPAIGSPAHSVLVQLSIFFPMPSWAFTHCYTDKTLGTIRMGYKQVR